MSLFLLQFSFLDRAAGHLGQRGLFCLRFADRRFGFEMFVVFMGFATCCEAYCEQAKDDLNVFVFHVLVCNDCKAHHYEMTGS